MNTKQLQAIAHEFLVFPAVDEITLLGYTYEEIFLYVRALWSHGFLSDESALGYLRELKRFAVGLGKADQFPKEADQFIFLLGGKK